MKYIRLTKQYVLSYAGRVEPAGELFCQSKAETDTKIGVGSIE